MSEYFVETQNMVEMDVAVEDNNLDMDASTNQNVPMTTDQTTRVIEAISPTAEVTRVEGGAKITITDKNGTTEATINDGQDGTDGEKGDQGDPGPMPDFSIGNVSTGAPGSDASVTITGTPAEPYLNFTIPRGDKGEDGGGIPSGGTTGQFLKKASTTDFDVEWDSVPDPTNKADKVSGATSGNFAGLDGNGNLTDSGHKHSDYLTSHQDISGKADKVSSATSGNFAGLDGNGNLTDSGSKASDFLTQHQDISGKLDKPVTAGTSGQVLTSDGAGGQTWQTPSGGTVTDVQEDGASILSSGVANILTMTGASSSSAGTKGLVPAPTAGQQNLVLTGAGSWQVSPGAKLYTVSGTMTGTTLTISNDYITADMKCIMIEIGTPSAFDDTIHVLPANGSVTISCDSFSGSSTVKATLQKVISDPTTAASTEFDVLNNRIATLNSSISAFVIDGNTCSSRISKNAYVLVKNSTIENRPDGLYESIYIIEAGTAVTAGMLLPTTIGGELRTIRGQVATIEGQLTNAIVDHATIKDSVAANSSGTFTLPGDGVYLFTGYANTGIACSIVKIIGGYVTASRCIVTDLVSGQTGVTIDSSNTQSLTFTITNSTSVRIRYAIFMLINQFSN